MYWTLVLRVDAHNVVVLAIALSVDGPVAWVLFNIINTERWKDDSAD